MTALGYLKRTVLKHVSFKQCAQSSQDQKRLYDEERPTVGFFSTLTEEQRKEALSYRGPDNLRPNS